MKAPPPVRRNPLTHSPVGLLGLGFLALMVTLCLGSLPWTLGRQQVRVVQGDGTVAVQEGPPRYNAGDPAYGRIPPMWADGDAASGEDKPEFLLGSDELGRSLWVRVLTGGGISLGIGIAAAAISVFIGTMYGGIAGYAGGMVDGAMMRVVDILYGLPYILLVVLLAVSMDGLVQRWEAAQGPIQGGARTAIDVATLLIAIGGVSWLTMARVVRGQVLSLKNQPFVEAARAGGTGVGRIFTRHLLPNLVGPIIVYATLTVPQAILQESFLSFLGIGVKPPLPSWGNLAADALDELNKHNSYWWLLAFPCLLLGLTLLSLNFVGEGLREAFDPRARKR